MALQQIDPNSIVTALTTISFVISPFKSPRYNLPINLFGIYAIDKTESNEPLRLYTGMTGISIFFDIIYMWRHDQNGFIKLLTIILTIAKLPTFLIMLQTLKARGDQYASSIGGAGFQSQTVWSMPGAYRQGGYESVGDDLESAAPQPQQANPSHHHQPPQPPQPPQAAAAALVPGGYQAS